jgi:phosphoglycolate phosphatase
MTARPENVLLDLDGTLADPRAGFVASVRHALESLGYAVPTDDRISGHIGPPLEETFAVLLGPHLPHNVREAVRLYRERYLASGIFETRIYEGVPDALAQLHAFGCRMFLATSKPHVFAVRILEHFGLSRFFSAVYGSEVDGTRSDKGQLISYILKRELLSPASTVMVGDRAHDVRGALANGVSPIGVLWGYGSHAELTTAGAKLVVDTPAQLACTLASDRDFGET